MPALDQHEGFITSLTLTRNDRDGDRAGYPQVYCTYCTVLYCTFDHCLIVPHTAATIFVSSCETHHIVNASNYLGRICHRECVRKPLLIESLFIVITNLYLRGGSMSPLHGG